MGMQTKMRYYCIPIRMAKIQRMLKILLSGKYVAQK